MQASSNSIKAVSTAVQLLPTLKSLQNHEKLFVIQFLVAELSKEEHALITPGRSYPIWSPIGASSAAETLLQILEKEREV